MVSFFFILRNRIPFLVDNFKTHRKIIVSENDAVKGIVIFVCGPEEIVFLREGKAIFPVGACALLCSRQQLGFWSVSKPRAAEECVTWNRQRI